MTEHTFFNLINWKGRVEWSGWVLSSLPLFSPFPPLFILFVLQESDVRVSLFWFSVICLWCFYSDAGSATIHYLLKVLLLHYLCFLMWLSPCEQSSLPRWPHYLSISWYADGLPCFPSEIPSHTCLVLVCFFDPTPRLPLLFHPKKDRYFALLSSTLLSWASYIHFW